MEEYHWNELLPIDGYRVRLSGLLHSYDRSVITRLYQPLIGSVASSLFMTLWDEVSNEQPLTTEMTHHSLLSAMQLSLKEIFKARQKLEGIGLLRVYVQEKEEKRTYLYELHSPLTPQAFFSDPILNIFLYGRLGARKYNEIKAFYSFGGLDLTGYREVTRSFYDVFQPITPSQFASYEEEKQQDEFSPIGRSAERTVRVNGIDFDMDVFLQEIEHFLVPKKVITEQVRELVLKLAFLYSLSPVEMATVVVDAREGEERVNTELIRKFAREKYQFKNEASLPMVVERTQPIALQTMVHYQPTTKEEEFIKKMETTSPLDFLTALMGGAQPSQSDVKIIEGVMINQKLSPGVVNVLIHYVLLKTDMKLTKGYIEKIASHWARKKVQTVKQAMELAKKEHESYQEWTKVKQQPKRGAKSIRKEILPEWAMKQENKKEIKKEVEKEELNTKEKEREELQALLNQFKKE